MSCAPSATERRFPPFSYHARSQRRSGTKVDGQIYFTRPLTYDPLCRRPTLGPRKILLVRDSRPLSASNNRSACTRDYLRRRIKAWHIHISNPSLSRSLRYQPTTPTLLSINLTQHSVTMGNTIAPMQRDLILMNTDSARDARETLDRLEDMAQDRIDLFYDKIGYVPFRPECNASN